MGERARYGLPLVLAGGLLLSGCASSHHDLNPKPTPSATAVAPKPSQTPTQEVTPSPSVRPSPTATHLGKKATSELVKITFYGAYDNDPPGSEEIAHDDIQPHAGGTGTYNDPLTLAARLNKKKISKIFKPGTIVYVDFLRKYFERSDDCGTSQFAPDGCDTDIDLYMGNPSKDRKVLDCENALTLNNRQYVIINPQADLPVTPEPLWNDKTGKCFNR